jgi:hypothetical protein
MVTKSSERSYEMKHNIFSFAKPSILTGVARLFNFGGALNVSDKAPKELGDDSSTWEHWKLIGDDMQKSLDSLMKEKTKNTGEKR